MESATETAARIDGRKVAEQVIELGDEAAAALDHPAALDSFWARMLKWLGPRIPKYPTVAGFEPMSDAQAVLFEKAAMPWGKHAGELIGRVPLEYLVWLVDQRDEFTNDLRRYVRSKRVQGQIEDGE